MVKAYRGQATTYMDGKEIHIATAGKTLSETKPEDKTFKINWDNLDSILSECGILLPFNTWNFKKGRIISFFETNCTRKHLRDIKEWKTPIDFTLKIEYKEYEPSIEEILKYHGGELAIKYLVERGLSVVGK